MSQYNAVCLWSLFFKLGITLAYIRGIIFIAISIKQTLQTHLNMELIIFIKYIL